MNVRHIACTLLLAATLAGPAQAAGVKQGEDPFAYCAANGTVDEPSGSFRPNPVPAVLVPLIPKAMGLAASAKLPPAGLYWRCMDQAVWVCSIGANLPCATKADRATTNTGAENWCKDNPNSDFVPAFATGHDTIYDWSCSNGRAVRGKANATLDRRGYRADIWYRVDKP